MYKRQQQAQEIKKLYAVAMRYYGIGEITEYAVVKETPKTYAVEPLEDFTNPLNRWHRANIVKKSDMEIYDKHFCESYAAALAYKKEMLETLIAVSYTHLDVYKRQTSVFVRKAESIMLPAFSFYCQLTVTSPVLLAGVV